MKLSFRINKPINTVFDYLSDMKRFVSIHPVITSINKLDETKYLVHETLKFAGIPFSFDYTVTIVENFTNKEVVMIARIWKFVKIEITYLLSGNNRSTLVSETIVFISKLPVKGILGTIFRRQHTAFFKNMEAAIEKKQFCKTKKSYSRVKNSYLSKSL